MSNSFVPVDDDGDGPGQRAAPAGRPRSACASAPPPRELRRGRRLIVGRDPFGWSPQARIP